MHQQESKAFSKVLWIVGLLKVVEKSAWQWAAVCLLLMLVEFLRGTPFNPLNAFGTSVVCALACAFVIELTRVVILFIKWARRKRQACKGG
ncbi:hypothetical protein [Aeromonas salmonicida]|uniref:hypothetical protein n=1 Tax=Aeromonas salmonicida TaxID=645 RepID=UPI0030CF96BA